MRSCSSFDISCAGFGEHSDDQIELARNKQNPRVLDMCFLNADLPDHVAYEFYFLRVAVLYSKESAKERDGNSGENLRAKITKPAGLDAAQGGELHKVALQCLSEARGLDLRVRSIIRQCRSKLHQGKLGARQEPPALPPELAALQSQRNAIFLHGRDLLHNELGDKFAEFDRFVRTTIGQ
jgi:hypothetical protein